MKYSVCIEMIGTEAPFYDRIDLAADLGYDAVEFWGWARKDLAAIVARTTARNVTVAGFVGTANKLVNPVLREDMVEEFVLNLAHAKELNCRTLIVTTGNELPDFSRQQQHDSIVQGLKVLAPLAEEAGVVLAVEPLNSIVDHKGYYLNSSGEGFDIIREVNSPAVRLLFDVYHQQITEGNVTANLTANIDLIGHIHIADVPGRHEPGTGELNFRNILSAVEQAGYTGFIGLEFRPTIPSKQALCAIRSQLP